MQACTLSEEHQGIRVGSSQVSEGEGEEGEKREYEGQQEAQGQG